MWKNNTADPIDVEAIDSQALTDACMLLFGDNVEVSPEFISYMQIAGLRAAFRNMAMRNHPDLALQIGVDAPVLQDRFNAIRKAYELLLPYVAGEKRLPEWEIEKIPATERNSFYKSDRTAASPVNPSPDARIKPYKNFRATSKNHTFAAGKAPRRVLRIGEFLYYNRKISWENMFSALVWQRLNRPRLGDIALEKGMFTANDMLEIRRFRRTGELLGETAVRLKIVSDTQLRMLLGYQKLYNCPLGRYFIEDGLLRAAELDHYLQLQRHHNLCYQRQKV